MKSNGRLAVLSIALVMPWYATAQTNFLGLSGSIEEFILSGGGSNASFLVENEMNGVYLAKEISLSNSGSRAHGSALADKNALHLAVTAGSFAGDLDAYGSGAHVSASASQDAAFEDELRVFVPQLPRQGDFRFKVRLLIESTGAKSSTAPLVVQPGFGGGVSVTQDGKLEWNRSFSSAENLLVGEYFVDLWVYLGPATYSSTVVRVAASANSGSGGGFPAIHTSSSSICHVTWGGIASAELNTNVLPPFEWHPVANFYVTNSLGRDYRVQAPRPDLAASIKTSDSDSVTLNWPGSQNIPYQVQSKSSLSGDGTWSPVGDTVLGNGANSKSDPIQPGASMFYRVVDAPSP